MTVVDSTRTSTGRQRRGRTGVRRVCRGRGSGDRCPPPHRQRILVRVWGRAGPGAARGEGPSEPVTESVMSRRVLCGRHGSLASRLRRDVPCAVETGPRPRVTAGSGAQGRVAGEGTRAGRVASGAEDSASSGCRACTGRGRSAASFGHPVFECDAVVGVVTSADSKPTGAGAQIQT